MWNYLSLTRHEDGCKFIRRDGPGFETEDAAGWESLCKIMDVCESAGVGYGMSLQYPAWWAKRHMDYLAVREAGVTFVMYEYADEAGREDAAMAALRAMFAELEFDFNFQRIVREPVR